MNRPNSYPQVAYFFDVADPEPMPDMLIPVSWETVKKFFIFEAPKLSQKYF